MRAILQARWVGYGVALATVAAISGLIGFAEERINLPNMSMLTNLIENAIKYAPPATEVLLAAPS